MFNNIGWSPAMDSKDLSLEVESESDINCVTIAHNCYHTPLC